MRFAELYAEMFDSWDTLKGEEGDAVVIAYVHGEDIVLLQDDAIQAAEALDEGDGVVFCGVGCFWKFHTSYRAFYFKRLEKMGKRIKYAEATVATVKDAPQPVRPEKLRLPEFATVVSTEGRKIDGPTGRVYIGKAAMGTFWWCPSTRMVYMRRNNSVWIGQFCTRTQWGGMAFNVREQLPIPA